jgi:hypothetical protein
VFDGDDIDDWKASALGVDKEDTIKSCSGIVARKSGSFVVTENADLAVVSSSSSSSSSAPAAGGGEISHYRITVQDVGKSRGTSGSSTLAVKELASKKLSTRNEHTEPIDDFLQEFENEIVLDKSASASASTVTNASTTANIPLEVASESVPFNTKENEFR